MYKSEKKRATKLGVLALFAVTATMITSGCSSKMNSFSFNTDQKDTIQIPENDKKEMIVETGNFSLPSAGSVNVNVNGRIDSGELSVHIIDKDTNKEVYQMAGEQLKVSETIQLDPATYIIQVKANNYDKNVINYNYKISINND